VANKGGPFKLFPLQKNILFNLIFYELDVILQVFNERKVDNKYNNS